MKIECTVEEWQRLVHGTDCRGDGGRFEVVIHDKDRHTKMEDRVARAAKIQKEYSCNCTLNVETVNSV
ncbi:MAG: hypothetical protein MR209_00210 [Veillonellaceae bacterium]|nr:hypothetical protein [Veillonellaceae bacterium]